MGVKYGKDVLYFLSGLSIRDAVDICPKLAFPLPKIILKLLELCQSIEC